MSEYIKISQVISALLYTGIGLALFFVAFEIVDKVTPYKLWEEVIKNQNRALAIVIGAISLGISLIIAAAIHG
jgi:putative membrane protein